MPPPPPPAAPPPPVASSTPAVIPPSALLQSIQKGAKLKKAVTNDRSQPLTAAGKSGGRSSTTGRRTSATSKNDTGGASSGAGTAPAVGGIGGLFAGGIPKLKSSGGVNLLGSNSNLANPSPTPASRPRANTALNIAPIPSPKITPAHNQQPIKQPIMPPSRNDGNSMIPPLVSARIPPAVAPKTEIASPPPRPANRASMAPPTSKNNFMSSPNNFTSPLVPQSHLAPATSPRSSHTNLEKPYSVTRTSPIGSTNSLNANNTLASRSQSNNMYSSSATQNSSNGSIQDGRHWPSGELASYASAGSGSLPPKARAPPPPPQRSGTNKRPPPPPPPGR